MPVDSCPRESWISPIMISRAILLISKLSGVPGKPPLVNSIGALRVAPRLLLSLPDLPFRFVREVRNHADRLGMIGLHA